MMHHRYTPLCTIARIVNRPQFVCGPAGRISARLFVFTDPMRGFDPIRQAAKMPQESVLVYRHFGAKGYQETALKLQQICQSKNAKLLIGADPKLAADCGADGVHLPQRMINQLARIKAKYPLWWISCAAHSVRAARMARSAGADQIVFSSVFASSSPSASAPLGASRFALAVQQIGGPVIALGGIDQKNAAKLSGLCHGIAVVSAAGEND